MIHKTATSDKMNRCSRKQMRWRLVMLQISGLAAFSAGGSTLVETVNPSAAPTNGSIIVTATFTNLEAAILRGFYYEEQLPSTLRVTPLSVRLNGAAVRDFKFESGQDGDVYDGLTPQRWILESPTNFSEANPVPVSGVVQIVYRLTAASPGDFSLGEFAWVASYAGATDVVFGAAGPADCKTITFLSGQLPAGLPWVMWWQNASGASVLWQMDGTQRTTSALLEPARAGSGWRIAATGDFNHDGQDDLVLEHGDGQLAAWFMVDQSAWNEPPGAQTDRAEVANHGRGRYERRRPKRPDLATRRRLAGGVVHERDQSHRRQLLESEPCGSGVEAGGHGAASRQRFD